MLTLSSMKKQQCTVYTSNELERILFENSNLEKSFKKFIKGYKFINVPLVFRRLLNRRIRRLQACNISGQKTMHKVKRLGKKFI